MAIILFINCAGYKQMKVGALIVNNGSTVETMEYSATVKVDYKSYDCLLKDLKEKARSQMWNNERVKSEMNDIPIGGYITVKIFGRGMEITADPKVWEFLVRSTDGSDIFKFKGKGRVLDYYKTGRGTTWCSLENVSINQEMKKPFLFYAFDNLNRKMSSFKIYPNKTLIEKNVQHGVACYNKSQ
jgi:hypothetical protein